MLGLPLAFTIPFALVALAGLPVLYVLLKVTPPRPQRVPFPPLKLILDLKPKDETPANTPWWLLLLRLTLAALIILAMAGPIWNPISVGTKGQGTLLVALDDELGRGADVGSSASSPRPSASRRRASSRAPSRWPPTSDGAKDDRRDRRHDRARAAARAEAPVPYTPDRTALAERHHPQFVGAHADSDLRRLGVGRAGAWRRAAPSRRSSRRCR